MHYFLDCEFNAFEGELLSLALIRHDGESLYLVHPTNEMDADPDPWVLKNVIPILYSVPSNVEIVVTPRVHWAGEIAKFLEGDPKPYIVTDWPDDIAYFCKAVITSPGYMAAIPSLRFEMVRVDAYPTDLPDAVQHNAWWDAAALRHLLQD